MVVCIGCGDVGGMGWGGFLVCLGFLWLVI